MTFWCVSVAAFGEPVVPEVNWMLIGIVRLKLHGKRVETSVLIPTAKTPDMLKTVDAGFLRVAEKDDRGQARQPFGPQGARGTGPEFRGEASQQANVVARLEPIRRDQRTAFDLVERVLEFRQTIGRIDVDQNQSRLGAGILGQDPLDPVRRPDANPLARPQAQGDQAGGETVNFTAEISESQADALIADDDRFLVRPAFRSIVEGLTDRLIEQRRRRGAARAAAR
jgi:hypothetical protein